MTTEDKSALRPNTVETPAEQPAASDRQQESLARDFIRAFCSFLQGMRVTAINMVSREKITVQYPYETAPIAPRFRGVLFQRFDNEARRLKCTGCSLCAQACPTKAISMTKLGAGKNAGVSEFKVDLGHCMFCNMCVEACPFDAIHMGQEYELASFDRHAGELNIETMTPGGASAVETSIHTINEALAAQAAEKAAQAAEKAAQAAKVAANAAEVAAQAAEKAAKAKKAEESIAPEPTTTVAEVLAVDPS